jgi:hypothetical protein
VKNSWVYFCQTTRILTRKNNGLTQSVCEDIKAIEMMDEKPPTLTDETWDRIPKNYRLGVLETAAPLVLGGVSPDEAVNYALAQVIYNNLLLLDSDRSVLNALANAWGEENLGANVLPPPPLFRAWKACLEVVVGYSDMILDGVDPVALAFREKIWISHNQCVRCGGDDAPKKGVFGIHLHSGKCEEDMKKSCAPAFRRIAKEFSEKRRAILLKQKQGLRVSS